MTLWFRRTGHQSGNDALCEDALPLCFEDELVAYVAVADGLGGRGALIGGEPPGKVASREAIAGLEDYLRKFTDPLAVSAIDFATSVTNIIHRRLVNATASAPRSRLRGDSARQRLGTTLAGCLVGVGRTRKELARLFWIGDSRIYLLTTESLHQISVDDASEPGDALRSLTVDSPMSQFLADDMDAGWAVHCVDVASLPPGLLFVCTDGCFAYIDSPWKWEQTLVESFRNSAGWTNFVEKLGDAIDRVKGDDASFAAIPIGGIQFDGFRDTLLTSMGDRECYAVSRTMAVGDAWAQYRKSYERYLGQDALSTLSQGSAADPPPPGNGLGQEVCAVATKNPGKLERHPKAGDAVSGAATGIEAVSKLGSACTREASSPSISAEEGGLEEILRAFSDADVIRAFQSHFHLPDPISSSSAYKQLDLRSNGLSLSAEICTLDGQPRSDPQKKSAGAPDSKTSNRGVLSPVGAGGFSVFSHSTPETAANDATSGTLACRKKFYRSNMHFWVIIVLLSSSSLLFLWRIVENERNPGRQATALPPDRVIVINAAAIQPSAGPTSSPAPVLQASAPPSSPAAASASPHPSASPNLKAGAHWPPTSGGNPGIARLNPEKAIPKRLPRPAPSSAPGREDDPRPVQRVPASGPEGIPSGVPAIAGEKQMRELVPEKK